MLADAAVRGFHSLGDAFRRGPFRCFDSIFRSFSRTKIFCLTIFLAAATSAVRAEQFAESAAQVCLIVF